MTDKEKIKEKEVEKHFDESCNFKVETDKDGNLRFVKKEVKE